MTQPPNREQYYEIINPHYKEVDRAMIEMRAAVHEDFETHFRLATDSLVAHELLDAEHAETIHQAVATQRTLTSHFDAYTPSELMDMSCETAADMSADAVLHTVSAAQSYALELAMLGTNEHPSEDSTNLWEASKLSSDELVRLTSVTLALTTQSGKLIDNVSSTIIGKVNPDSTQEELAKIDFKSIKIGDEENHRKTTEATIDALRNPKVRFDTSVPGTVVKSLIQTYRQWVDIRRALKEKNALGLSVAVAKLTIDKATLDDQQAAESKASSESLQEAIAKAQAEIDQTIAEHATFTREFRPTWNQVKGAGLRGFSNELRRPDTGLPPNIDAPTSKRYTGILHVLERLGATDPDVLQEKFSKIITREFILGQSIDRVRTGIETAGGSADTWGWLPVTDDMDFMATHRGALEAVIRKEWTPRSGNTVPQSIDAIMATLRAYTDAKKEFEHPERRLERIAQSLGAVALPPEARPELKVSSREQRRQNARDALQTVANNEKLDQNIRQRSLVIDHFLDTATGQVRPEDGDEFGQLYITDPVKHGARYFCVTFRAPDETEWILLESLKPKVASYVIPKTLVAQFGPLGEFIKSFGKREMQVLGSQQVIHVTDWTVGSHITAIMNKIATSANRS